MEKLDRTKRQLVGLGKWKANKFRGIAQYPTGFGKTYTAILGIRGMIKKANIKSVLVVVPTIELKKQWEQSWKGTQESCSPWKGGFFILTGVLSVSILSTSIDSLSRK